LQEVVNAYPDGAPVIADLLGILIDSRTDVTGAEKRLAEVSAGINRLIPPKGNLAENRINWLERVKILTLKSETEALISSLKKAQEAKKS
jgi:hypothetical protein